LPLDQQQKDSAIAWLSSIIAGLCPSCHSSQGFSLVEELFGGVVIDENKNVKFNNTIPMIGLMCNECFNIRMFSAVAMGIVHDEPPPQPYIQ
jgi:hypothetical protein